jgi:3' exoribonuclease, RNase T-like
VSRREVYVSTDIEADGPIPGPYSMLSFASVAFSEDGAELASFTRNLDTLPGAAAHPETMAWWQTQQAAWAACRERPEPPESAMRAYLEWLAALPGKPVFVAYPAGFDFTFVHWYLHRFCGESPFSHAALDVKSFAMAVLRKRFHDTTKRAMPRRWFPDVKHTHVALDDAREQGLLFLGILKESRAAPT